MKIIERKLPFTDKTEWAWPDEDEKLVQVFDHVSDIDEFMRHVEDRGVCVQAGGACGVWPFRYSQLFDQVITFEPMVPNRQCLNANIAGIENIRVMPYALSDHVEIGSMVFDRTEHNNYGAVYFQPGNGEVQTTTIDSLGLTRCDFIQLDIEGHELQALKGAEWTIHEFQPVIVLEEKPLVQLSVGWDAARKWLESEFGYREADRVHKDVILTC